MQSTIAISEADEYRCAIVIQRVKGKESTKDAVINALDRICTTDSTYTLGGTCCDFSVSIGTPDNLLTGTEEDFYVDLCCANDKSKHIISLVSVGQYTQCVSQEQLITLKDLLKEQLGVNYHCFCYLHVVIHKE